MKQVQPVSDEKIWWIPISAAIMPFVLWPVEMLLPYPALIEETAKGYLVLKLLKTPSTAKSWQMAMSVGLLFGGSETLLYTVNAILIGNLGTLVGRVLLTMPMHVATVMVMFWLGQKGKYGIVLGWILAVGIHAGFNEVVSG